MEALTGIPTHALNRIQEGVQTYGEYLVLILLCIYLLMGFRIIGDYGISMDEPIQRKHGIISFEYVNERLGLFPNIPQTRAEQLMTYDHREYGVFFQMVSYGIERLLGIQSASDVFLLRHMLVFLLFWASCYCFSQILYIRYQKWWISLLGTLFLILSPRIFAQAFYNPKDIVFMSWTLISIYTFILFLKQQNLTHALHHGIICALAINARVTGVFIPVLSVGLLVLSFYQGKRLRQGVWAVSAFVVTTILATILFWPYLWESPWEHFLTSFNRMKRFDWYGEVWYLGQYIPSTRLPWHYIPVLMGVTTPLLYVILFGVGLTTQIRNLFPRKFTFPITLNTNRLIDLSILGYFFIPLIAVVVLQSVLYNGWRHLYFIYPACLITAVHGVVWLAHWISKDLRLSLRPYVRLAMGGILLLSLSKTFFEMVRLHPHQQVYFNELVYHQPHRWFEMDYSGTSYKQALAFLLEDQPQGQIHLHVTSPSGKINQVNFAAQEIARLNFVSLSEADFLISNFHFPSNTSAFDRYLEKRYPYSSPELFSINYRGSNMISIYDLRNNP